jgi:hypothetical protein
MAKIDELDLSSWDLTVGDLREISAAAPTLGILKFSSRYHFKERVQELKKFGNLRAFTIIYPLDRRDIPHSAIFDTSALEGLKHLQELELKNFYVTKEGIDSIVAFLPHLRALKISGACKFDSVESLKGLESLETLHMDTPPSSDIDGLKEIPNLRDLRIQVNTDTTNQLLFLTKLEKLAVRGELSEADFNKFPAFLPNLRELRIEEPILIKFAAT